MEKVKHKKEDKGLTLTRVHEGLRVGVKSDGTKYSVRESRSRFFFPNEWENFIEQIKLEKRLVYDTLIQTGARIEEALNLKPRDFDWTRNNLTLRVTKIKARKGEKIGQARTLPVSSQYIRKVRSYINKNNIGDDTFLFPMTKQAVWQMMRRGLKKSEIKDDWNFGLHNIRKTHGNWLKALEISAEEICTRLGHDFNTYLKHYGSPNIFDRKDKVLMIKILGDVYGFK
ncbi:MAG: site-specific integrase [Alphaproteobacteria bacterium]|nr:MAG: site-specific integrase [Alphaproteobacteria bacterium]